MIITAVNIPKNETNSDGLEKIEMKRLQQVVLLAGKNGSGKSRILDKIESTLKSRKPNATHVQNAKNKIKQYQSFISNSRKDIEMFEKEIQGQKKIGNQHAVDANTASLNDIKQDIITYSNDIDLNQEILDYKEIETDAIYKSYKTVRFVPKSLRLNNPNDISKNQLRDKANLINQIGFGGSPDGVLAKIQYIQDVYMETSHQNSNFSEEVVNSAKEDFDRLNEFVQLFLNTPIGRTKDGTATLFDFPLGLARLSDGQKILLQFCLALYSQKEHLNKLILFMDEPENHLHPAAIIETIDKIIEVIPNGQVWIATHSIPLLSHFDPSKLWFVNEGNIKHAGKIPEQVLSSLLGDDENIGKLKDFMSLPAQYASTRYAFESLFEPMVVQTAPTDNQSLQIKQGLIDIAKDDKIKVLDFGAGKGRIIENLNQLDIINHDTIIKQIDYIAFDKYDTDADKCKQAIISAYGNCDNRYYNNTTDLLTNHDSNSFQVVIMCNVLHEIDPRDWLDLFKEGGIINKVLANNGFLLVVEDNQIPVGEKAYQNGFLVLDSPELKELFKITTSDTDFCVNDASDNGRLKSHLIPANCLTRINAETKKTALKSVSSKAQQNIKDIREKETNYENGKLHGFWVQQFANSKLALSEIEE